jgi:ArsR family transcriptional regulator, arsenate/arsenite/antimonite-responsive transcriptional repressor
MQLRIGRFSGHSSHHLRVLREVGLVDMEKDLLDGRWVYYSINETALQPLNEACDAFFQPERVKPRHYACGPSASRPIGWQ